MGPIDISGFDVGENTSTITFSVYLTNASNVQGDEVETHATLIRTAPPAFTISPIAATLYTSTAADGGFIFNTAEVNDQYSYTITSNGMPGSGQVASVSGTGSVNSANKPVPVDLSSLVPGQLTYTVTLTNSYGNTTQATTTGALYTTFTVTSDDQGTFKSVAGFTLGDAEVGDTYNYTVTDSNSASVSGNGAVTSATQDVTGIDVSTLAPGSITFSVTLTDTSNNVTGPVTATATIDPATPTAIELSTSVVPTNAFSGTQIALLQTVSAQPTAAYTYSLVNSVDFPDNASFQIVGNQLVASPSATFSSGGQPSYTILVQSTDSQGRSIDQQFVITVSNTDPVTPSVTTNSFNLSVDPTSGTVASGTVVGSLATSAPVGGFIGSTVNYTLVSGSGDTNNGSFQIVNGQLETTGALGPGSYTVLVQSTSTYLISDRVDLGNVSGAYEYESPRPDPVAQQQLRAFGRQRGADFPHDSRTQRMDLAVNGNQEFPGSQAQLNYLGSYTSFTAANPSATVANSVGSSGVYQATSGSNAWAVVDPSSQYVQVGPSGQYVEYATGVQVFTQQIITINVS